MGEQVAVRIIRTLQEIESIRSAWSCWKTHPYVDVDFYLGHESTSPGFVRPHIIVLYRDGRPDAIVAGKIVQSRVSDFPIGPWFLCKPHARVLRIESGGALGNLSAENCSMMVRQLLASLRRGEADFASFRELTVESSLYDLVTRSPSFLARDPFPEIYPHYAVNLPNNIEAYFHELSPKGRWNIKRKARQLEKEYSSDVTTCCFRESAQLDRMMQDVEDVAKKTWQRGVGGGFRDNEEMRRRYALAARSGWLRAYILYAAGMPCAFQVGTLYSDTYYLDFTGYDPTFAKYSPGICLLMKSFEDLCKNNVKRFDFAHGSQEYKERLGNYRWQDAFVHMYSPSPKGIGLKALRTVTRAAHVLAKGTVQQAGFLRWLKNAWHRRATPRQLAVRRSNDVLQTNPSGETKEQERVHCGEDKRKIRNLAGQPD